MKCHVPVCFASALLFCVGCMTLPAPGPQDVSGEWRFAYVRKARTLFGMNPSPPSFDIIEFKQNGEIRLVESMKRREVVGKYTLDNGILRWEFTPPEMEKPVVRVLDCFWEVYDRNLVLRIARGEPGSDSEIEWVYFRPKHFLSTKKICGKWVVSLGDKGFDMTLTKDGRFRFSEGKEAWGYYRLWRSRLGRMLTMAMWVQGEGAFTLLYLYKVKADTLTLTPFAWNGPVPAKTVTWTRAPEAKAPGQ